MDACCVPGNCVDAHGALQLSDAYRQRLPEFTADIVVRVLEYSCVPDIGKWRLVCRMWRNAIDGNSVRLWKTRCISLGFFPPEGTDTVLGRSDDRTRLRIETLAKEDAEKDVRRELMQVYRNHYLTWVWHICFWNSCHPTNLRHLKSCCSNASDLKWMNLKSCISYLSDELEFNVWKVRDLPNDLRLIDEASDSFVSLARLREYEDDYALEQREDIYVLHDKIEQFSNNELFEYMGYNEYVPSA